FVRGFQWVDGSFVERKDPQDIDVVTFLHRPPGMNPAAAVALVRANPNPLDRARVKAIFRVDLFLVDLDGSAEAIVNAGRYYAGLFSHRRADSLWKGMLQVTLEDTADDAAALAILGPASPAMPTGGASP